MNKLTAMILAAATSLAFASAASAACGDLHTEDMIHWHVPQSLAQLDPTYCGPIKAAIFIYNPPGNPNARVEYYNNWQVGPANELDCNRTDRLLQQNCSETHGVYDLSPGEARVFYADVPKLFTTDWEIEVRYFLQSASEKGVQVTVSYLNDCTHPAAPIPPNWQPTMSAPQQLTRDGCR